jgi:hypothetical protein
MAFLVQQFNDQEINRWELTDRPVILGRSPGIDVHLKDPGISREHAQIRRRGNIYILTDLNSFNGSFVNNKRVLQAWLIDGDEIAIGKFLFQFSDPEYPVRGTPVPEKARFLLAWDSGHKEEAPERDWTIHVTGPGLEKHSKMFKSDYCIGRGTYCDIMLEGRDVEEMHAMIVKNGENLRILNLAEKRPTLINGSPAPKKAAVTGKVLMTIGKYTFILEPA